MLSTPASASSANPFRQFIVKLHSRCNLACDYCYVYTKADQRWRGRPRTMSPAVARHTADRVAEHVRVHHLTDVEVIIHGGEPLLAGTTAIEHLVTTMRSTVPATVRATVQTNATLLDRAFLDLFLDLEIGVGVSLDGGEAANDRHRVRPDGTGSYRQVHTALRRLQSDRYRGIYRGLLCTVDIENDPVKTYEDLLDFEPPVLDLLLPHGNWMAPPAGVRPGTVRYAEWLIAVFNRWYSAPSRETGIRLFEEIINALLGGHSRLEGVGLAPPAMIVVETDGAIEQSDILASVFEGAAATGLHVSRDSFDSAARLPEFQESSAGPAALSATCRACELRTVCGGGLRAHRYRAVNGFDNPSVYCADLFALITAIRRTLVDDIAVVRRGVR